MLELLFSFWAAVAEILPHAWALPPRLFRLTHGAGVCALSYLMDEIADGAGAPARPVRAYFGTPAQRPPEVNAMLRSSGRVLVLTDLRSRWRRPGG